MIKKSEKILKIAKIGLFVGATILGASFIGCLINAGIQEDAKSKTNYENANILYKQVQIDDLNQQYNNGEITSQEYQSEIDNLKNLNVHDYMNADTSVPTDVLNQYNASYASQSVFSIGLLGGMGAGLISTIALFGAQMIMKIAENKGEQKINKPLEDDEVEIN